MVLNGVKISIVNGFQNKKLSNRVNVSREFRQNMDEWLADFFGYTGEGLKNGEVLLNEKTLSFEMNKATMNRFKCSDDKSPNGILKAHHETSINLKKGLV